MDDELCAEYDLSQPRRAQRAVADPEGIPRRQPDFTLDPARAFAHYPETLWRCEEQSIVERWYDEVQEQSKSM